MITNDIETFYKNMEIHDKRKIARLEQENKQLKEQLEILLEDNNQLEKIRIKAIEYINKRMIREGEYWIRKAFHFRNTEYGKDLLQILGDKEND